MTDAMTRPPMVTDDDAAEIRENAEAVGDPAAVTILALLADRAELWEFVKLVRNTGAQHCMPLAEKLLERKKEAGREA